MCAKQRSDRYGVLGGLARGRERVLCCVRRQQWGPGIVRVVASVSGNMFVGVMRFSGRNN